MDLLNGIHVRMPVRAMTTKKKEKRTNFLLDWFKIGRISESGNGEVI